jgi:hypothetical protein
MRKPLATFIVAMTVLGFVSGASAATRQLAGEHSKEELAGACGEVGGQYYQIPYTPIYGCKVGAGGRVDCVQSTCWGTSTRLIGPFSLKGFLRRPGATVSGRSLGTSPEFCRWCYETCRLHGNPYFCVLHCQTRGGCLPPTRGLTIR